MAPKPQVTRQPTQNSETNWKQVGAPYVEPNKAMLGDKHLNPEESVVREREDLLKIESKKRIHGQDQLEKSDRSLGPRLYFTEILRRLWKCNPRIRVKEGSAGSLALYVQKRKDEYRESDYEPSPNGAFFLDHKYVGGLLKEWLPEWGHVTIDTSLVAHHEVRGWRSVLIALIKAKVITYQSAIEQFGDPFHDQRSQFWFEQTAKHI
jgi:hypothetical protein